MNRRRFPALLGTAVVIAASTIVIIPTVATAAPQTHAAARLPATPAKADKVDSEWARVAWVGPSIMNDFLVTVDIYDAHTRLARLAPGQAMHSKASSRPSSDFAVFVAGAMPAKKLMTIERRGIAGLDPVYCDRAIVGGSANAAGQWTYRTSAVMRDGKGDTIELHLASGAKISYDTVEATWDDSAPAQNGFMVDCLSISGPNPATKGH